MSPSSDAVSTPPAQTGTPMDAATSSETVSLVLRYFAAAADAAGRPEERLDLPTGTTLAGLREQLAGRGLEMARVVPICSFLVNSVSTRAGFTLPDHLSPSSFTLLRAERPPRREGRDPQARLLHWDVPSVKVWRFHTGRRFLTSSTIWLQVAKASAR